MVSMEHEGSQKTISPNCAMGYSVTSGFCMSGGAEVAADCANYVLKKGPWSPEEDALLIKYVKKNGEGNWKLVQKTGLMRCGKSCRLRWTNHLKPDLKKGPFSLQEEKIVIELHQKVGNKWSKIAAKLPGRTDNEVKNFWNTKIKKRMRKSKEAIKLKSLPTQQSEGVETPSNLPSKNSLKLLLPPKKSSLNSSIPYTNPKSTFSLTNPSHNPSMKGEVVHRTNSKTHQENPLISFPKSSTYLINFSKEKVDQINYPSLNHILPSTSKANLYPGVHVLEFARGTTYFNPNPFSCAKSMYTYPELMVMQPPFLGEAKMVMHTNASASTYINHNSFGYSLDDGMWMNGSLSYEPNIKLEVQEEGQMTSIWSEAKNDQVSIYNGYNYSYGGLSKMDNLLKLQEFMNAVEIKPKKEPMEVDQEMEFIYDELSSLANIFSFDESPPELNMTKLENVTSGFRTHFYLDQKLAFPSFSGPNGVMDTGCSSSYVESSEIDECFDVEDWINATELD